MTGIDAATFDDGSEEAKAAGQLVAAELYAGMLVAAGGWWQTDWDHGALIVMPNGDLVESPRGRVVVVTRRRRRALSSNCRPNRATDAPSTSKPPRT